MAADVTGNEDIKTWGYITFLSAILFGTTLPFFVVRTKVREMRSIEVCNLIKYKMKLYN